MSLYLQFQKLLFRNRMFHNPKNLFRNALFRNYILTFKTSHSRIGSLNYRTSCFGIIIHWKFILEQLILKHWLIKCPSFETNYSVTYSHPLNSFRNTYIDLQNVQFRNLINAFQNKLSHNIFSSPNTHSETEMAVLEFLKILEVS